MNEPAVDNAAVGVVKSFLGLLVARQPDAACDLLAEDASYINVSLPAIRGREAIRKNMKMWLGLKGAGFEVYYHHIGVDGGTVLTERTDALVFGPVRIQIWVWGRFDVVEGKITLWKDYFDWWNVARAVCRGLVGALVPSLRTKPPASAVA